MAAWAWLPSLTIGFSVGTFGGWYWSRGELRLLRRVVGELSRSLAAEKQRGATHFRAGGRKMRDN